MIIVRELTGGIYYGTPRGITGSGAEERGGQYHDLHARGNRARRPHGLPPGAQPPQESDSVDKSNVLENSQLWRRVVVEVAHEFPDVELDHMLVDNCAMQLVLNPQALRRAC